MALDGAVAYWLSFICRWNDAWPGSSRMLGTRSVPDRTIVCTSEDRTFANLSGLAPLAALRESSTSTTGPRPSRECPQPANAIAASRGQTAAPLPHTTLRLMRGVVLVMT